ncbi:hypothetical protein SAMN05216585_4028 [Pseudomonas chlororaphis]|nr:hypothetical protein SAMN05216585_4028 [Pseudomonas chlororaphis]
MGRQRRALRPRELSRGSVQKVGERRSGKAKTGEEAECRDLHEHSEPVFNAA